MNLEKLKLDIKAGHPCLRFVTFETLELTAENLRTMHRTLMSDDGGVQGYLYQIQVANVKQLREELKQCRQMINK